MEVRVLRYFLAIAREESISKAAEILHVTQPTLSRQLMDLEKDLGQKLFARGTRRMILTEEGLFLRKRAEEIIELVDKTAADFNAKDDVVSGEIYIGSAETDAIRLIARTIRELKKNYPHIQYHIFSGNGDAIAERLDMGLLDFGILIEPAAIQKYDYLRLPATDTWGILMRKDSPLAELDTITADDLWELPLLCSQQSLTENELSGWLGNDSEKLNITGTYNLLFNAALLVEEGVGYALCLDKLINTSGNSELCFRPLSPRLEAGLNIVWKKHQVFSRAARIFLAQLQKEIAR